MEVGGVSVNVGDDRPIRKNERKHGNSNTSVYIIKNENTLQL